MEQSVTTGEEWFRVADLRRPRSRIAELTRRSIEMSRLQEDFWEQVAKPYGYERPLRHELRAKGYRSP